ncbi:HD domain-containing protein [Chondromyces apiculatus]|uniref:Putative metal-dependent phosphohydrolase n=1 Tax=Chondromyces apiculatus DSM 436 TaxID=1192034 RepID=A0A017T153_9BACT|nr:HD domain-containing protein [Chondromyces apiculatus]EYF02732.1 Putative metal-dependent phosphohydrolase [Chondromyces apiculatus DSM 436]
MLDLSDLEQAARTFAAERHGAQRYGDHPYTFHLERVRAVLADHGYGGALGVAAWLHDILEDTPTTRDEIADRFGAHVAALVWAVTGVGATRKERNASMYGKIRDTEGAALLKLADRIANVEAARTRPDKLRMYRSEAEAFTQALAGLGDPRLWARLQAAFAAAPRDPG